MSNSGNRPLAGRVAFITGAARGQGRSHAVRLAGMGADIIAADICGQIASVPYPMSTPADLEETVRMVEDADVRIYAEQADVRSLTGLKAVVGAGVDRFGRLDIVLANAGIASLTATETDPELAFDDTIAVNLRGVWNTVQAAVPTMIAQASGGVIVLTSSTQGLTGRGGSGSGAMDGYVASKHALVGLMRTWANWLAPHNIRVNTIHPTGVDTAMIRNPAMRSYTRDIPEIAQSLGNLLAVEALDPSDVSNAIAWLVSDEARFVTGISLPVDAGFTVR
jgi:SDR family mycofactocin-dependent oxidoreductase